jgi:hypothetical protein
VSIIAKLLLDFYSSKAKVSILCGNQGAISKCSKPSNANLRYHRWPNIDLLITQRWIGTTIPISYTWVKSHSNKEPWETIRKPTLILQLLVLIQTLHQTKDGQFSPGIHKLIGDLSVGIPESLGYNMTLSYIKQKHNLDEAKLMKINLEAMHICITGVF